VLWNRRTVEVWASVLAQPVERGTQLAAREPERRALLPTVEQDQLEALEHEARAEPVVADRSPN
jgi:hypothetical protein